MTGVLQRTRRQILDYLNRHGPSTVDELAGATGVVPVTVRAHLGVLEKEGFLVGSEVHSGRAGRPRIYYSLTPRAREVFPKGYDQLALRLLATMPSPKDREAVLHHAGAEWAERVRRELEVVSSDERITVAVRALNDSGCEAEWQPEGQHLVVRLHNCPYSQLVQQFPELCEMERAFLADLLNVSVRIEESGPSCTQCVLVTEPAGSK